MMCITRDEALAIVADMACPTVYNLFSNLISKRYEFIRPCRKTLPFTAEI